MKQPLYIVWLVLLALNSCTEPFYPEIDKYENLLVVEALLTDQPGPQQVLLSRSFKYSEIKPLPESGAQVYITDDKGLREDLSESVIKGTYYTSDNFSGKYGNTYQLHIACSNSEYYVSEPEPMPGSTPISKVTHEYHTIDEVKNGITYTMQGMKFFVDNTTSTSDPVFYQFMYDETWKFRVPYSQFSHIEFCWDSVSVNSIQIFSTKDLDNNYLDHYPVLFTGNNTNKLAFWYSLLVKQLSISEKTYNYMTQLSEFKSREGTLYDIPPTQIIGNIAGVNQSGKRALGYFNVASQSSFRDFTGASEIPELVQFPQYPECETGIEIVEVYEDKCKSLYPQPYTVGQYLDWGYTILDIGKTISGTDTCTFYVLTNFPQTCIHCFLTGTAKKPSYWKE